MIQSLLLVILVLTTSVFETANGESLPRAQNTRYYTTRPFSQELDIDVVPYSKLAWQDYIKQHATNPQDASLAGRAAATILGLAVPSLLSSLFSKPVDTMLERQQLVRYARAALGAQNLPLYNTQTASSFELAANLGYLRVSLSHSSQNFPSTCKRDVPLSNVAVLLSSTDEPIFAWTVQAHPSVLASNFTTFENVSVQVYAAYLSIGAFGRETTDVICVVVSTAWSGLPPFAVLDVSPTSSVYQSKTTTKGYWMTSSNTLSFQKTDLMQTTAQRAFLVQRLTPPNPNSLFVDAASAAGLDLQNAFCDNALGVCLNSLGPLKTLSIVPYELQPFYKATSAVSTTASVQAKLHSEFLYSLLDVRGDELVVLTNSTRMKQTVDFSVLAATKLNTVADSAVTAAPFVWLGSETLVQHATAVFYNAASNTMYIFWNANVVSSLNAWQGVGIFFLLMFLWRRTDAYTEEKPEEEQYEPNAHAMVQFELSPSEKALYASSLVSEVGTDTTLALYHAATTQGNALYLKRALLNPVFVTSRVQLTVDPWIFAFVVAAFITCAVSGTLAGPTVSSQFLQQTGGTISSTTIQPIIVVFYVFLGVFSLLQLVLFPMAAVRAWQFETRPEAFFARSAALPRSSGLQPKNLGLFVTWQIWLNLTSTLRLFFCWVLPRRELLERFGVSRTTRARDYFLVLCGLRLSGYVLCVSGIVLFLNWNLADTLHAGAISVALGALVLYLAFYAFNYTATLITCAANGLDTNLAFWSYGIFVWGVFGVLWTFTQLDVIIPFVQSVSAGSYDPAAMASICWSLWVATLLVMFSWQMYSFNQVFDELREQQSKTQRQKQ